MKLSTKGAWATIGWPINKEDTLTLSKQTGCDATIYSIIKNTIQSRKWPLYGYE
jgi:hypothetical protein